MDTPTIRLRTRQTGAISTTRSLTDNLTKEVRDEVSYTDIVPVPEDLKNPGYVSVKGGLTKNMGNFESVNVSVSISMPCRATPEDVSVTYRWCSDAVSRLLTEQYDIATGAVPGATS